MYGAYLDIRHDVPTLHFLSVPARVLGACMLYRTDSDAVALTSSFCRRLIQEDALGTWENGPRDDQHHRPLASAN